jgi:hypothetical protein
MLVCFVTFRSWIEAETQFVSKKQKHANPKAAAFRKKHLLSQSGAEITMSFFLLNQLLSAQVLRIVRIQLYGSGGEFLCLRQVAIEL